MFARLRALLVASVLVLSLSLNEGSRLTCSLSLVANVYTNIDNWLDVKSLPSELGQIGGIALSNANDELVVFHRGSRKWEYKYEKKRNAMPMYHR
jgi:hypothetical protein